MNDSSQEIQPFSTNGFTTLSSIEILTQRARDLAAPRDDHQEDKSGTEVLEFHLSGEKYVISMEYIKEVALLKEITYIPGTPPFILGIISLHGSILSIVDLRIVLGMPPKGLTDFNRIIVLSNNEMTFGVLADAIDRTRTINTDQISRPPPTISGPEAAYLSGVLPGPVMVIDARALLSNPGMILGDD
ncbi:MAG TPA: chemotaxis protein CheW [Methanospirillum sp.]|uniref:chemotaxis protein CheW n=1 Tax=Methanospirillum sp. TaxID=45200 RepID=UPI002CCA55AD|nr:chemotaxis protein CheW [Methanospirillum sp.]HWQ63567.1 chemotaxis protein CheW [Methanospirillum sp.]